MTKNQALASWFNENEWPNLFVGREFTSSIQLDFSQQVGSFLNSFFGFLQNTEKNRTLSKTEISKVARLFAGISNSEFFRGELANSLLHLHIYNSLIRAVKPRSVLYCLTRLVHHVQWSKPLYEGVPTFTLTVAGLPPHARGISW